MKGMRAMPVIYLDVLMALNLFIDFLLLSATVRILRIAARRWRVVMGALFAAACSCLIFLPELPAPLSALIRLAATALIVLIAFPWAGILGYIKQITVFFVLSTIFAGLAFALWFFAAPAGFYVVNSVVYYDVSPLMLVALTVISYLVIWIYDRFTHKSAPISSEYRILIEGDGGTAGLHALYDTGNSLTEPFSGSPVIVACEQAVRPALSETLWQALEQYRHNGGKQEQMSGGGTATALRTHIRLIPFHSVGGKGLLPAFRPDRITVLTSAGVTRDISGAYIAICSDLGRGNYDALIGTDIAALFYTEQNDKGRKRA